MLAREATRTSGPLVVLGGLSIFSPLIEGGTTHLPVLIIRLVLLSALTVWVIVSMKSGGLAVYRSRLYLPMAVFLGWAVLSVFWSPYTAVSVQWLLSLFSYAVMLVLGLHLVASASQVRRLVLVILGLGLFEAVVGSYQFIWLRGQSRVTGTFFNPNFFAAYEAAILAVVFGMLCFWSPLVRWKKLILWLMAGMMGLAFLFAQSRGALLALVVATAFIGLARFGRRFLVVLLLGLLAGAAIPNPLQHRTMTIMAEEPYGYSTSVRMNIWKSSLERVLDHPWGVGLGVYQYSSFRYRFPIEGELVQYRKRAESAHNEYLQIAVELGLPGLVIFLVGMGFLGREIWEALQGELEPWERGMLMGLTGGSFGMFTHAAVDSVWHEPTLVLLIVLFVGMILVLKRLRAGEPPTIMIPFPYHPARVVLVGVLAILSALLVIRPAAAWYAFAEGQRELAAGRPDQARDRYAWAARIDPGTSAYHDATALAEVSLYRQSGERRRLQGAISEEQIGLELNPLDGRLANRLGELCVLLAEHTDTDVRQKQALLEQAAAYYEQAIQLDPYSPFNYVELGRLRLAQGRLGEAQAWFRQAIGYEPNFLPARVHLIELSLKAGKKADAALEYAEILKIKKRYQGDIQGGTLIAFDRQFLDVDHEYLKRLLASANAS